MEDKVNPLYTDLDSTNFDAAEVTGTGKVVLQTSPTFLGTVTSAAITMSSGSLTLATGSISLTAGDITLATTKKLNLNVGGTSFLQEDAANQVRLQINGVNSLYVTATNVTLATNLIIPTTKKVSLNAGATSFIYENSASDVRIATNSSDGLRVNNTLVEAMTGRDLAIQAGNKFYLDGVSDSYIFQNSDNDVRIVTNGTAGIRITATLVEAMTGRDLVIQGTNKFYLDGGADVFFQEDASNQVRLSINGDNPMYWNTTDVVLKDTGKLRFDGSFSGDTYAVHSSSNVLDFYVGAANILKMTSTYIQSSWLKTDTISAITSGGPLTIDVSSSLGSSGVLVTSSSSTAAAASLGLEIQVNTNAGNATLIKVSNSPDFTYLFDIADGQFSGAALGAFYKKVAINIPGVGTKYIPVYA